MTRKAIVACILMLGLVVPGLAGAHAGLAKSIPGSRAQLARSPSQLELCFNEPVELNFSSIKVLDDHAVSVSLGVLQQHSDPKCIQSDLPTLSDGIYTVNYRVLSQDGHVVQYGYQFTIRPDADVK
jgi:methionine-rich copper-binding protein CopC